MTPRYHITSIKHLRGHVLRIAFADGVTVDYDFGPWFNAPKRTAYEKRYRAIDRFKQVKNLEAAIEWGDMLIGMYAEDLREGQIPGIEVLRQQAA